MLFVAFVVVASLLPARSLPAAPSAALADIDARLDSARSSFELGEPQLAEHHDRLAAADAWTRLGELSLLAGELDVAEEAFRRAASAAPAFAIEARALLAATRSSLGDLPTALEELRLAVTAAPENVLARRELVRALAASGTFDEARSELEVLRRLHASAASELQAPLDEAEAEPARAAALFQAPPRPSAAAAEGDAAAVRARLERALQEVSERREHYRTLGGRAFDGGALAEWLVARIEAPELSAQELQRIESQAADPSAGAEVRQQLARFYFAADRRAPALEQLRQAAERGVLDRDLSFVLAELEAQEGRLPASNRQLRNLVKHHASPAAHLALARNALAFDHHKLAYDHAGRAHALAPAAEAPLGTLAEQAFEAGIGANAARAVEILARMRPEDPDYAFLVGRVWMTMGESGEAAEALQRTLELDAEHLRAHRLLGLALARESRFEEARGHLTHYLDAGADEARADTDVQAALAECEERLGEAEAAEARARGVLEYESEHALAQLVLGMVLSGRGEFEPARAALEGAVEADPKLAKAHYQLSFACARLGDRECAKEHLALYRRALEGDEADIRVMQPVKSTPAEKDGAGMMRRGDDPAKKDGSAEEDGAKAGGGGS